MGIFNRSTVMAIMVIMLATFSFESLAAVQTVVDPITRPVTHGDLSLEPTKGSILPQMIEKMIGNEAMEKLMGVKGSAYPASQSETQSTFMMFLTIILSAVMAAGSILLTYNAVMGAYNTATQGEFLGKKWESAMMPFRSGMSIVTILPIPQYGGLALCQVLIISGAGWGMGIMDFAWGKMVDNMIYNRSTVTAPSYDPGIEQTIKNMVYMKTCVITLDGVPDGGKDGKKTASHFKNVFTGGKGKDYAKLRANGGGGGNLPDGRAFPGMISGVTTPPVDLTTVKWIIGPLQEVDIAGGNESTLSCGEMSFKSGIVSGTDMPKYAQTVDGNIEDGITASYGDSPIHVLAANVQNSVTKNNMQRMLDIWNSKELNLLSYKIASGGSTGDELNPIGERDYQSLISLATRIQTSVVRDIAASGTVPTSGKTAGDKNNIGRVKELTSTDSMLALAMKAGGGAMAGSMYWKIAEINKAYTDAMRMGQPISFDPNLFQSAKMEKDNNAILAITVAAGIGACVITGGLPCILIMATAGGVIASGYFDTTGVNASKVSIQKTDIERLSSHMKNTVAFFNESERIGGLSLSDSVFNNSMEALTGNAATNEAQSTRRGFKGFVKDVVKHSENNTIDVALSEMIKTVIYAGTTPALKDWTSAKPQPDPMLEMKLIGDGLMWIGAIAVGAAIAGSAAASIVSLIPGIGKVGGMFKSSMSKLVGGGKGSSTLGSMATIIISITIFGLIGLGVMLAWVIPALPYTTWTLALMGYLIMFCEALVAAPLWALAHAWPEGEGPTSQMANKGYMLFLRVMLKPVFMLFGFFIGMQLVYVMGWWVDTTIWDTLNSAFDGGKRGTYIPDGNPFSLIGMLVIYTGLMLAIVHKSFEMTVQLDDWVFEWLGGAARDMGDKDGANHVMGVVNGVKSTSTQMGQAAGGKMGAGSKPPGGGGEGAKTDKMGGLSNQMDGATNAKPKSNGSPRG